MSDEAALSCCLTAMLQLSGSLRGATVRLAPLSSWRLHNQQSVASCSGAANPSPVLQPQPKEDVQQGDKSKSKKMGTKPMIRAVFNTLKIDGMGEKGVSEESSIVSKIRAAESVEVLLKFAEDKHMTRENAFVVMTQLVDWVNQKKTTLSDFERDRRFLRLRAMLLLPTKPERSEHSSINRREAKPRKYSDQLDLFYGMQEINEATKEVANITVHQMVKVMSALASQKRRTTPLLRSLSFNISRSPEVLNAKELSDLLYSMAVLNYPDEVLLQKLCADLILSVKDVNKSVLIGSILTSLGMLRYKNEQLLDELSEATVRIAKETRAQDLCALFMTLATLGYTPSNITELTQTLIEPLQEIDMTKPAEWLDIVWAFTVLGLAQDRHVASVLDSSFVQKLADSDEVSVPKTLKLLNINGAAKLLMNNYKGPLLDSSSKLFNTAILRSKEKLTYARAVVATLENILPSPEYLTTNVDTGMGFLLDAEFCVDRTGKRLPLKSVVEQQKGFRIAVIAQCYHDFCRGKQDPLGCYDMYYRLLKAKGYKILSIPHSEFRLEDKIVQRLAFVNDRIKAIAT